MELLQQNLPQTLMVAGIAALIIEVAVLGFATFILLFFGASLLITGFAMSLDLLPATATAALWSNTTGSGAVETLATDAEQSTEGQHQKRLCPPAIYAGRGCRWCRENRVRLFRYSLETEKL